MIVDPLDEYPIRDYPRNAIRLDLNESPIPPPREVLEEMARELERVNRYPEARLILEARRALAEYSGVDPGMVALTGGGDYGILTLLALFKGRWGRIIVPAYTYSMTPHLARALGMKVSTVPMVEGEWWGIDEDRLFKEARIGGAIFIDSPNNPTGSRLLPARRLVELAEEARGPVVVDEAYYDFEGDSIAGYTESHPNLISLRTLSKAFSLAGMRVGYIIAEESVTRTLRAVAPFPVSRPGLAAVKVLASNPGHVRGLVGMVKAERERLKAAMRGLGLRVYNSRTNFLLVDTPLERPYKVLEEMGVYVKRVPIRETMMRATVGAPRDNDALLSALAKVLS
ncbi:MAG: aminotransferase class I/II-fold pyridoxal phosphate-dependent enzyme [Desulfurococcales archaeon]|nr:aminotransferase class I/II-fold pyridoxal phosphate-dependent enzyme [Desulfurococcales archaeon]